MATIKQKRAFKEIAVNGGNITAAMRKAGYAPSITNNTDKLTNSLGWQELMNEYLPDSKLAEVHQKGLEAMRIHTSHTEPDTVVEDWPTRAKYLDMAYKVKGNYAPEKSTNVNINVEELRMTIKENLATFRTDKQGTEVLPQSTETI